MPRPAARARADRDTCGVALAVEGTTKTFAGVMALDDVSIELHEGEILGLIGPNGAGKTTLFDVVSGFLVPNRGRVLLGGRDLAGLSPPARARLGLARSFQNARLFGTLTVHQTLCIALDDQLAFRDPALAALQRPNVRVRNAGSPSGPTSSSTPWASASSATSSSPTSPPGAGGSSTSRARSAPSPTVILLDEPSAGIAQRETEALAPVLLRLRDVTGASLLVIEHDLPLIMSVSDRIVALDVGSGGVRGQRRARRQRPAGHRVLPRRQLEPHRLVAAREPAVARASLAHASLELLRVRGLVHGLAPVDHELLAGEIPRASSDARNSTR